MEPIRFIYDAKLRLKITRAELATLRTVCERHYDSTVRGLSIPGRGAVLNGAATMMADQNEVDADFTFRDLDVLAKGLEQADSEEEVLLAFRVRRLLRVLAKEDAEINKEKQPESEWWAEQLRGT